LAPHILTDPNELATHLPVRKEVFEKLEFPDVKAGTKEENTDNGAAR
jgi:hypothetical protein